MPQWCSLSDSTMGDTLIEVPTMRRFAGIELISDKIPNKTTILSFRHLLEKINLGKEIFQTVKARLGDQGVTMRQRTIIDATLFTAPSSTKNKTDERGPEMHQTKTDNQCYYGMKVHIGVDKDSVLIHSVETTTANVHDITRTAHLLHGQEEVIYGDAGYQGIEKRPEISDKRITFRVAIGPGKCRVLPDTPDGSLLDLAETAKAHIRAKVGHLFRMIKQQLGF